MAHPPLWLLLTVLLPWPLLLSRGSGGKYLTVVRDKGPTVVCVPGPPHSIVTGREVNNKDVVSNMKYHFFKIHMIFGGTQWSPKCSWLLLYVVPSSRWWASSFCHDSGA